MTHKTNQVLIYRRTHTADPANVVCLEYATAWVRFDRGNMMLL